MLIPAFSGAFSGNSFRSGEGSVENRIFLASVFLLVRTNRQAERYLEKRAREISRLPCPAIRFSTGFPHVFPHGFPHKKMKSRTVPDFIFLLPVACCLAGSVCLGRAATGRPYGVFPCCLMPRRDLRGVEDAAPYDGGMKDGQWPPLRRFPLLPVACCL